jgi:hypothetical protein
MNPDVGSILLTLFHQQGLVFHSQVGFMGVVVLNIGPGYHPSNFWFYSDIVVEIEKVGLPSSLNLVQI